jgi:hypothetical protein
MRKWSNVLFFIFLAMTSVPVFSQEDKADDDTTTPPAAPVNTAVPEKKYTRASEWEAEASAFAYKTYQDSLKKSAEKYKEVFDDLELSRTQIEPEIEHKHRNKGYIVFYPPMEKMILPRTPPVVEEISVGKLALTMAADEWESAQLGIWTLRDLSKVSVKTSDLKQKGGSYVIGGPNVRTFFAYSILVPKLSKGAGGADGDIVGGAATKKTAKEKNKKGVTGWEELPVAFLDLPSLDMKKDFAHAIWIDVYAPTDAPGGEYEGEVTISSDDRELARVPISATVRPFVLDQAKEWGRAAFISKPRSRSELIQMKEHGLNMVSAWWAGPDEAVVLEEGKLKCDFSLFTNYIKLADEVGMVGPHMVFLGGSTPKIQNRIFEILKRHMVHDSRNKTNGITYEQVDYSPPFEQYYVQAVKEFHQQMKAIGHGDMPVCLLDEPDHEPRPQRRDFYQKVYAMVEKGAPEVPTYGVFYHEGDEDRLSHHHAAWCTNRPGEKIAETCKKAGRKLWTYGFGFKYHKGMDYRFAMGVIPWVFDAQCSLFWANYWNSGDVWDPLTVRETSTASLYTPAGPISTPALTVARENIDDGRYIRTLEKLIAKASTPGSKGKEEAKLHADFLASFKKPFYSKLLVRGGEPDFTPLGSMELIAFDGTKLPLTKDVKGLEFAEFLRKDLAARIISLQEKLKP